jgi:ABC-type nitrate/sulfonate/bicarbonate transport system substrate-binding protein
MTSEIATGVSPTVSRGARAAERWGHAIVKAKGDAAFFYMAQNKGFWAKHDLAVDLLELTGSRDVTRTLVAGEVDSADITPADVLPALEKGADLRFVGSAIHGYPYALYVRSDVKSWADLADKRIGVSAPGSAPHVFALAMLRANNVPTAGIRIVTAGGSASRIRALASGRIDATAASSEFVPQANELGIKVLGLARDALPLYPRFYQVMSARTIERRRDAATRFLAGYLEGLRYCVRNREESINLAAEISDQDPHARFAFAYDEIVDHHMVSVMMDIPRDKIAWMQDMMIRLGRQEKPLDLDRFIDTSLRDKALQLLATP